MLLTIASVKLIFCLCFRLFVRTYFHQQKCYSDYPLEMAVSFLWKHYVCYRL